MSPAYEERRNEEADENIPRINLAQNETERLKTGSETSRSTLQEYDYYNIFNCFL